MSDKKTNRYGCIVNVSSLGGSLDYITYRATPGYSISKAALNALTRKLAAELVHAGILVNSVDPELRKFLLRKENVILFGQMLNECQDDEGEGVYTE